MSNLICKMIFSTSLGKAQEFAIEIKIWQQMWFFSLDAYIIYIFPFTTGMAMWKGGVGGGEGGEAYLAKHIFGQYTLITPPPPSSIKQLFDTPSFLFMFIERFWILL